jgi:secreted Zn-dependent insulinase-like peptidase
MFRYLQMLREKLNTMSQFRDLEFFRELKIMSDIGFSYYKVPEPMDNVCDIANELLFSKDLSKILKDTYPDSCLEELDMKLVKNLLNLMTVERSKIVINGKNLIHDEELFGDH